MKSEASYILSWTFVLLIFCECAPLHAQNKKYNTSIEVQSGLHVQWNQIDFPHSVFVNSLGNMGLSANSLLYRLNYEKYSFLLGFSHKNYYQSYVFALQDNRPMISQTGPNHTFYLNTGIGKNYRFGNFGIRPEITLGIGYVDDALYARRNNKRQSSYSGGLISNNFTDTLIHYEGISYSDNILHLTATFSSQFSFALGKNFDFCLTPYFTKGINTYRSMELDYFFKDEEGQGFDGEGKVKYRGTQFGLRFGFAYHLPQGRDLNGKRLKQNDWALEASYLFKGFLFENIHDASGNHSAYDGHYNSSNMRLAFISNKQKYYRTYSLELSQYYVGFMESNITDKPVWPNYNMSERLYFSSGLGKKFSYGNFHFNPSIRLGAGFGFDSFTGFEENRRYIGVTTEDFEIEAYYNNPILHFRLASRLALEYSFFKNFYVSVFPEYIQGINQRARVRADYTYNTGESGSVQVNSRGSMFGFGWAVGWYMK